MAVIYIICSVLNLLVFDHFLMNALVYLFVNFWERLNQLVVNIEQEYIHLFIE